MSMFPINNAPSSTYDNSSLVNLLSKIKEHVDVKTTSTIMHVRITLENYYRSYHSYNN